jgi:dolichol-phosphate mannosyltransferase
LGLSQPGVLIILPVLNEAENIDPLISGIRRELRGWRYTICIIDDGSKDGTVDIVLRLSREADDIVLLQREKKHHGSQRGGALKYGLEWGLDNTDHEVFVEMDGDLSHRSEELLTGIAKISEVGWNVAIASKYVSGSRVLRRPLFRRLLSRFSNRTIRMIVTLQVRDWSNGYRFYDRIAAEIVRQHYIRYGSPIYLTEVLALWIWKGLHVGEFASTYVARNEGFSKLRWVDLIKAGIAVCEIGLRFHVAGFRLTDAEWATERPAQG